MIEYMCRIKWGFSRYEYLDMTLKDYVALRDVENPKEEMAWADDVL